MAVGESAGSVYVTIDGDASPLLAKFAQAETAAKAAGTSVATGFNVSAKAADQTSASISDLIQVIREEGAAASLALQRNIALAGGIRQVGQAAHGSVTEIQAVSGAIRVGLGEQSIRAAERFLTIIPGIGAALQYAFPVIGALALFDAISHVVGKSEDLKQAEERLATATKAADDAFAHMETTLDNLNVEHVKSVFGAAAGTGAEAAVLRQRITRARSDLQDLKDSINQVAYSEAGAEKGGILTGNLKNLIPFVGNSGAIDKIKAIGQQIKDVNSQIQELQAQAGAKDEDHTRELIQQKGQLTAAGIALQEAQLAHQTALTKAYSAEEITQARDAANLRIAAMTGEYDRVVATGQAEVAEAKAKQQAITNALAEEVPKRIALIRSAGAAEAAGKPLSEQQRIGVQTQTKVIGVQAGADQQTIDAQKNVVEAQQKATIALVELNERLTRTLKDGVLKSYEDMGATALKVTNDINAAIDKEVAGQVRVLEVQAKATGESKALSVKAQQIDLEASYGEQVSHSLQQQLSYMEEIAALEHAERLQQIAGVQAELEDAEALDTQVRDLVKIATLKAEIAKLTKEDANASAAATGKSGAVAAQKSLGAQLGQSAEAGVASLTSAVAKGLTDGGRGLGKDIRQSLQGIGQQMLGDVLKKGTEEMVIALTGNTIATNLNTIWTEISAIAHAIFPFAGGTDSAPGGMALVGEKGPEIVNLPRGAQVIPNHKIGRYADGIGDFSRPSPRSGAMSIIVNAHAHGVTNPDSFVREVVARIPHELKRQSSSFAPYSR